MPKQEPLTRTVKKGVKHGPGLWGVYGHKGYESKLTDRAKKKLQSQINRSERIMRVEANSDKEHEEVYAQARRIRNNAQKMLGTKPKPQSFPGKNQSGSKKDKYEKRREPFERATGTSRIKGLLIEAGKAGQRK